MDSKQNKRNIKFWFYSFFNTLRLRWKGHHYTENVWKFIFFNEICCILIQISLKFQWVNKIGTYCEEDLTHWGGVMYICISNHHCVRQWLVAWMTPSHYLTWWWNAVNWTLRNKLQWKFNQNSNIFIQENALENAVWKIAAILPRPQFVVKKI